MSTTAQPLTNAEWRQKVSSALRLEGTELPYVNKYNKNTKKGMYNCAACANPLYSSEDKILSKSGWPVFDDCVPGGVKKKTDADGSRVELLCSECDGHLGHAFKGEGFSIPKDALHCVNSFSMNFVKGKEEEEKQGGDDPKKPKKKENIILQFIHKTFPKRSCNN